MSSHVVVIDSTARRATIKVNPGKHLSDVLQEACTKLGVDASNYGLKYVNLGPGHVFRTIREATKSLPMAETCMEPNKMG